MIKALIPVRSGSVRVENKNLRSFGNSNLLEIKLKQMSEIRGLDGVVVSSNDDEMLAIASNYGAEAMRRDACYATNDVSMSEVYSYMAKQINCDNIMLTHVTSPLVSNESYEQAIKSYVARKDGYDSLATVSDVKDFLYMDGKALNFDPENKPRSQDLPNIVKLTHSICLLPQKTMVETKSCIGTNPIFMKLSQMESLDIDTMIDFEIAEFLWCKYRQ